MPGRVAFFDRGALAKEGTVSDRLQSPAERVEYLNRGDCALFVGDGLDEQDVASARLAAAPSASVVLESLRH